MICKGVSDLHVPPTYDASRPVALVLSLHGGGGNAENQRRVSGFNRLADEKGFIVVYPNGTGRRQNTLLTWDVGSVLGRVQRLQPPAANGLLCRHLASGLERVPGRHGRRTVHHLTVD